MKKPLAQSLLTLSLLALQVPASAWDKHHGHAKHHPHTHYVTHHHTHYRSSDTAALVVGGVLLGAALAHSEPRADSRTYYSYSTSPRYSPSVTTTRTIYYTTPAPLYRDSYRPIERYETRPVRYSDRCYEVFYRNGVRVERDLPDEDCN